MVNLELFNIVDEIKKVSKAFVVHPKNVNADNAPSTHVFFFLFTLQVFAVLFPLKMLIEILCICNNTYLYSL